MCQFFSTKAFVNNKPLHTKHHLSRLLSHEISFFSHGTDTLSQWLWGANGVIRLQLPLKMGTACL